MITQDQYEVIKHYQATELKMWLEKNNLHFSDVLEASMNERRKKKILKIVVVHFVVVVVHLKKMVRITMKNVYGMKLKERKK